MLRDAQNLVKYVIRGVIQFFELLNTSLNAWFAVCFHVSKYSKPRKIRGSRHVSVFRKIQKPVKYVIRSLFQWFDVFKIS
jgi:hypothetical protein